MADGTEYTIELAAKVLGLSSASAQLAELVQKLLGSGKASEQAADALAMGEQRYSQLERAATKAAMALERAGAKTSGAVPADLAQKAAAAQAALTGEARALDSLRSKAAAAAAEHERLKAAFKATEDAAKKEVVQLAEANKAAQGTGNLGKLSGALGALGGPIGSLGQKATGLADAMGNVVGVLGTGPGALVAVAVAAAAAVVGLTVAIGAAIVKTAVWAVQLADAKRNVQIANEALAATDAVFARLGDTIPEVQGATGLAAEEIRALAKQLKAAKVSAADLPIALQALAQAKSLGLDEEVSRMVDELKKGKVAVRDLANEADRKFGKLVARKMLSLEEQSKTLKRNFADTFALEIEPLLGEFDRLVKLFDQTTASGKTIKFIFQGLFQPLIDAVAKAGPLVERFFLGMLIGALKAYIAIKPAVKAVKEFFGAGDSTAIDWLKAAELAGKATAAAILVAAGVVGLLVGALALPVVAMQIIGAKASEAFGRLYNEAAKVAEFLGSVDLSSLGSAMIQGLVNGIRASASKVTDAMGSVVRDAIASAKKALGIASPSKVFAEMGENVGAGFGGGVEDSSGGARSALESLVTPPDAPAGAGGGGSAPIDLSGAVFNFYGVKDAEDSEARFGALLTRVLEGDLTQLEPAPVSP